MSQSCSPKPATKARFAALPTATTRLFAASTITFFASWRGQLLVCTIVLVIGGIWFVVREPIARWRERRRERLSQAQAAELLLLEGTQLDQDREKVEEREDRSKDRDRSRDKRKDRDVRRRKGSMLKPPNGKNSGESTPGASSSMETSPKPSREPISSRSDLSRKPPVNSGSTAYGRHHVSHPEAPSRSITKISGSATVAPWRVPLPESPLAGSSRLPMDVDESSFDGDAASDSAQSYRAAAAFGSRSNGFSIMPENGYLPHLQPPSTGKKKKRKGKGRPAPLATPSAMGDTEKSITPSTPERQSSFRILRPSHPSGQTSEANDNPMELYSPTRPPTTLQRHSRKASLGGRPANMGLDELLTEREQTIDQLRAEVGLAKAEEAKSREDAAQMRANEEKLKSDVERARKHNQRSDGDARRREADLHTRLSQLNQLYNIAVNRLSTLEGMLRDTGASVLPPPSPANLSVSYGQRSPLMPSPSYNLAFSPSSGRGVPVNFLSYPSPGMYPSPMLHPSFHPSAHQHSHAPTPQRQPSMTGETSDLAGPLTPGYLGTAQTPLNSDSLTSPYMDIGSGIMPLGNRARVPSPSTHSVSDDLRRISIETSVMKKRAQPQFGSESGDADASCRALSEIQPDSEIDDTQGLGIGELSGVKGGFTGIETIGTNGSLHNHEEDRSFSAEGSAPSSHPTSPSPSGRAHRLLTPASAELYQQVRQSNGASDTDIIGIKMVANSHVGNIYYRDNVQGDGGESSNGSSYDMDQQVKSSVAAITDAISQHPEENSTVRGPDNPDDASATTEGVGDDAFNEPLQPMFASLAHTPAQLVEIAKMREDALKSRHQSQERERGKR